MNYIEIGETAVSLARKIAPGMTESAVAALSREGTSLLERSGFLSRLDPNHTIAHWLTDTAREAMPAIQRAAGSATHAGGDLLVVGKPFKSMLGSELVPRANTLTIYEPHQSISVHPDGQFRIDYPTPSGQRIRSDHYLPDGRWTGNSYASSTAEGYGFMPAPDNVSATVASQFGARQFMLNSAWDASRLNFRINPVIEKFIQESRPVPRALAHNLDNVLGRTVSTPLAEGKLVGFDRISGEALVTQDDPQPTGLSFDASDSSKRIGESYPVRLSFADDAKISAQRSPTGKLQHFKLGPDFEANSTIFAFAPLEVKLGGQPLSEILGVENSTGLRAMGGFSTIDGARVPIIAPYISHAPNLVPETAPRAFMDPIQRVASRSRQLEQQAAAKLRAEEAATKLRMEAEEKARLAAEQQQQIARDHLRMHEETVRFIRDTRGNAARTAPDRLSSHIDRGFSSPFNRSF